MTDKELADLIDDGVSTVRITYPDLHGIARGKEFPVSFFEHLAADGAAFCEAIMTVDLRHNVIAGFEHGFQDILAKVDRATLRRIPWDPTVVWGLADLERMDGTPYDVDPRGCLRRAVEGYAKHGIIPVSGPELEYYLCRPDPASPNGFRRYVENDSHVYTVGEVADPEGVLRELLHACHDLGLGTFAANHEFGRSQYEINLRHSEAMDATDRAFRFKDTVKEVSARHGLLATFIGKPFNDDEGSGFHLHLSLSDADGQNLLNGDLDQGLSPLAHHFIAGLIEHGPALMAFFNPTTNAYRRIHEEALVPTLVSWGHDNRLCMVRVPRERKSATRIELRVGDGAANVYLSTAAALFAGLDGIERELEPPPAIPGLIYEHPDAENCTPLPRTFDAALQALDADELLRSAMGEELVRIFGLIKGAELDRSRRFATDWEWREYAHHL
jgi:glutamine synthetase